MVEVIVAGDVVVDFGDADGLQVSDGLGALALAAIVEEDDFSLWRDEHGTVALADVHEMDLEISVSLAEDSGDGEETKTQEEE
jgi:hypothetical protein